MIKLFDQSQQQFGAIDIVVNNAGTGVGGPVTETDEADFDKETSRGEITQKPLIAVGA